MGLHDIQSYGAVDHIPLPSGGQGGQIGGAEGAGTGPIEDQEAIADLGLKAADQADIERAGQRGIASDRKLVEIGPRDIATDLNVQRACDKLGIVPHDVQHARRETRADLAGTGDRAGDGACALKYTALDVHRLGGRQVAAIEARDAASLDILAGEVEHTGLYLHRAAVVEVHLDGGGTCPAALLQGAGVVEGGSAGVVIKDDIDLDVEGGTGLVVEDGTVLEVNPPCAGHVGGAVVGDGALDKPLDAGAGEVQGAVDGEGPAAADGAPAPVVGAVDRHGAIAAQRAT